MERTNRIKRVALALAGVALLGTAAQVQARPTPEERLATILKGREAGKPVDCINMPTVTSSEVIDKTAIVYTSGSTLYVNRPRNGAESLDDSDVMVLDLHSSQLCRIDVIRMVDQTSHFMTGTVFLGDFVPYKRVKVLPSN